MAGRFARVPIASIADRRLNFTAVRVLMAICAHVDASGQCYPGYNAIARTAGLKHSNVAPAIKLLEASGYLVISRMRTSKGDRASNRYVVNFEDGVQCDDIVPGTLPQDSTGTMHPESTDLLDDIVPGTLPSHALTDHLSNQPKKQPKVNREKGTRLPAGAVLSDAWRAVIHDRRSDLDPDQVFEKFKLYYTSEDARKPLKRDWDRAWLNWILGERSNGSASNRPQGQNTGGKLAAGIAGARAALDGL